MADPRIGTKAELAELTLRLLNPRRTEEILKIRDPAVFIKTQLCFMVAAHEFKTRQQHI